MGPLIPWPPPPPPSSVSEQEIEAYTDKTRRWSLAEREWNRVNDLHNVWWRQFARFWTPWRSAYESVPAASFFDADLLNWTSLTPSNVPRHIDIVRRYS